ncbi:hypothetical protein IT570_13885 [Candidatus Sumerlaeota bacterium]|nr:hypothetical protein [Candidatus Sumerlaeota bacterium]
MTLFRTIFVAMTMLCTSMMLAQDKMTVQGFDKVTSPSSSEKLYIQRVKLFVEENGKLPKDQTNIVFVGDSITQGYKLKQYFPGLPVLNRGIGSDTIYSNPSNSFPRGILSRMESSIFDTHPRAMFLLIGTNHMGSNATALEELMTSYKKIIDETQARFPDIRIALTTLPPAGTAYSSWGKPEVFNPRAAKFNDMLRAYAKEKNLPLIDLGTLLKDDQGMLKADYTGDGIHLKPAAYEIWTAQAKKILKDWGEKVE